MKMADKFPFKMFLSLFLFFLISGKSFSLADSTEKDKCGCYSACHKNLTLNTVQDVQKITACQRGCRLLSLVIHLYHGSQDQILKKAKEDCLTSCTGAYVDPVDMTSCQFGCTVIGVPDFACEKMELIRPQITYSYVLEESKILIHSGEPELDDALTDPGLKKQIQKNVVALVDATPKIPEIRFTNLPVKTDKPADSSHGVLKCPKFYGFDARLEFRNGKIIIGDLYLFVGIFVFVVVCYLLSHYFETRSLKKHFQKKNELAEIEPLIHVEIEKDEHMFFHGIPPKPGFSDAGENPHDEKIESITLVFHDDESITKHVEEAEEQEEKEEKEEQEEQEEEEEENQCNIPV